MGTEKYYGAPDAVDDNTVAVAAAAAASWLRMQVPDDALAMRLSLNRSDAAAVELLMRWLLSLLSAENTLHLSLYLTAANAMTDGRPLSPPPRPISLRLRRRHILRPPPCVPPFLRLGLSACVCFASFPLIVISAVASVIGRRGWSLGEARQWPEHLHQPPYPETKSMTLMTCVMYARPMAQRRFLIGR